MANSEDFKPITFMKTQPAKLLKSLRSGGKPIVITQNGTPQAVIQDIGDYERQKRTMVLLRLIALGEKEIARGDLVDQADVVAGISERYFSK